MFRVGILGPTGFTGLELIRLLARHPEAEVVYLGSRRDPQPEITEIWPALRGIIDLRCAGLAPEDMPEMDVAFMALPHTVAMDYAPLLLDRGVPVVDLSADYRLRDPATYARYYQKEHKDPDHIPMAVYGLPELYRERIPGARLVANPGCYPTAVELALAPLLREGLAAESETIIVDAKSGASGAGRKPSQKLHYPEANENFRAYKVGVHQHSGEIQQTLNDLAGREVPFCFVPHIVPMDRGILATCYVPLTSGATTEQLSELFAAFYAGEPFVRTLGPEDLPETKDVFMTNFCDIAVRVVGDRAVVLSAIDNLVKGASGQAAQNMNLILGVEETLGLL